MGGWELRETTGGPQGSQVEVQGSSGALANAGHPVLGAYLLLFPAPPTLLPLLEHVT